MRPPLTRRHFLATAATSLAALALAPLRGRAQQAPVLELFLVAPSLAAGDRKTVRAELLVRAERIGPVMLTPAAEGTAVEVVRGRLTGEDAVPFDARDGRRGLRFAIPIAAHTPGTSVLRVHANVFGCDGACFALETTGQLTIRVLRART